MKLSDLRAPLVALGLIAAATVTYVSWLDITNATTVALTYLLIVLMVAASARLFVAVLASIVAMLCFNFFFLPPVRTWNIADPQNWVALFAFLVVSLVASRLSHEARARAAEAIGRRDELARLFDLSRDVLVMTATPDAVTHLARSIARRFDLEYVGVALPTERAWTVSAAGGRSLTLDSDRLAEAFEAARRTLEFDAYARTYAGHRSETIDGATVRLVPLRVGTRPVGMLAVSGRPVEPGTLDTLAGVVAIAVERMRFLADRQAAELTRQSEELKTALLASLGHDLRTPLTAIRVAASNLKAEWLDTSDRQEQSALILEEVDRLTRLFANILEMARLDSGAVERTPRWTHPSEIVTAARYQVAHGLSHHVVKVTIDEDRPVQLDAALTASALAQLLQNAAQYAPFDTPIEVTVSARDSTLHLCVRDHGPGIDPADLPHLFERFYRGTGASQLRASGSGLGLWIARGLLSAEGGRVWAENCPDGGAAFTITVPIHALQSTPLEAS
ncbi:MAG: DUF4118 domain-containing protein [Vicinamibacterales bacterium]